MPTLTIARSTSGPEPPSPPAASPPKPVIEPEHDLDPDEREDVPLEPVARAGGDQTSIGVRGLANDFELPLDPEAVTPLHTLSNIRAKASKM